VTGVKPELIVQVCCELDPQAYVLVIMLVNGHPQARIDDLLPCTYPATLKAMI